MKKNQNFINDNIQQHKVINKLLDSIIESENVLAVILYGSLAKGECRTDSDIDLQVLIENYDTKKQHLEIDGIEADISYDNLYYTVIGCIVQQKEFFLKPLGTGILLFDRTEGLFEKCLEIVKQIFSGKPCVKNNFSETALMKYGFENRLKEAKKFHQSDPVTAEYVMSLCFDNIMYSYDIYNHYMPAIRRRYLEELKSKDEFFWSLCCNFLSETKLEMKIKKFEDVLKYFLEPLGGFLPNEWEIPLYGYRIQQNQTDNQNKNINDSTENTKLQTTTNNDIDEEIKKLLG